MELLITLLYGTVCIAFVTVTRNRQDQNEQ